MMKQAIKKQAQYATTKMLSVAVIQVNWLLDGQISAVRQYDSHYYSPISIKLF